jgi:DNA mismatch endonuclease (patch repair protein)
MSAIRKRGNYSTEWKLRSALVRAGIAGWVMHETTILGCPDFWFHDAHLAVFVDGCFWHGCQKCCRLPKQNASYWGPKITGNISRDDSQRSRLKRMGIQVMRIWEHSLKNQEQIAKIIEGIRFSVCQTTRTRSM